MRKVIIMFLFFLIPQISLAYSTDYRFTGKPHDPTSNLYYFNQRYYQADIGRFTQADPLTNFLTSPGLESKTGLKLEQILANPQRLNSYSYSLNNPINVTDPTGESPVVSEEQQERFNQVSDYIRKDDNYWLVRDRDGNGEALNLIWQKVLELSKNDKGEINLGAALDTFSDAVNIDWFNDKTLDGSRDDYLDRLHNLPNALTGEYGGDLSNIDKLQHFATSAKLAYKYGARIAMFLGKLKEAHDGLNAIFNLGHGGYSALQKQDQGYSRGDIQADQMGILWIKEYKQEQIDPSITINNW